MQVLYDGHIFRWQRVGGVRRYFTEIIARLPHEITPTIVGIEPSEIHLPHHPSLRASAVSSIRPRSITQPFKRALWKSKYLSKADVMHPTYYALTGGLRFTDFKCPVVVTVHDFISVTFPHLEPDLEAQVALAIRRQREAILRADWLICISESTERELCDRYPKVAGKTTVIYHGTSFPVSPILEPRDIFEPPIFLFVGSRRTYKNFSFLLHAFRKACHSHPKIRLHVVGEPLNTDERWAIHLLGIANRVDVTHFPDDTSLRNYYHNSVALLYPSCHEGFGMPPVEAMACGTVVATGNTSSLPEVVGDAGIMLDPTDADAWTECILDIANARIPRRELIEKGRRRAEFFSWQTSAHRHAELYRSLS